VLLTQVNRAKYRTRANDSQRLNLSNTKEANKNRISEEDAKMKIIDSKCAELLDKMEDSSKQQRWD